jgi:NAD(P)-dependent dehydrogenase (short-subunit alcohol dehydrogenase family)
MFADLTGKVAVVTGIGSGIGRASALALARQGAVVFGCDLNAESAQETVRLTEAEGLKLSSLHPVNLSRPKDARAVIEQAVAQYGGIDILANIAAAAAPFAPFAETDFENQWRWTLSGELDLLFLVTQAAWPHLVERGGGSVINVASATAHRGYPELPALPHVTAKGGVLAMTRQLAAEGAAHGIRVNSVSPGLVPTPHSLPSLDIPGVRESFFEKVLIKRFGRPEDVSGCIVFLACEESSWVTGAEYLIDGGATAF